MKCWKYAILFLLIACKNSRKVIERYPAGEIKSEVEFLIPGDTVSYKRFDYYATGGIQYQTTISHGKFIGEKKSYYKNGNLERVEDLANPVPLDVERYDCTHKHQTK